MVLHDLVASAGIFNINFLCAVAGYDVLFVVVVTYLSFRCR